MYPLLETIQVNQGAALHLEWHQRRMDYAFHVLFGSNNPIQLQNLIKVPPEFCEDVVKCRILYGREQHQIEFSKHIPRKVSSLKLIECNTIDYSHKYTNRSMIEKLLEQREEADDILIVRDGLITDTSYTNIVFFDGKKWLTPEEPLLEGTARNRLIAEGKVFTARIRQEDLNEFASFRLINAMMELEEQEDKSLSIIIK